MKRAIIFTLSVVVLCLSFFSCGKNMNLYTIYVCKEKEAGGELMDAYIAESVEYNEVEQTYLLPELKTSKKIGMKDIDLVLGEQTFQLQYAETYNKEFLTDRLHRYKDSNHRITASYGENSGKLEYLSLDDTISYSVSDLPITSEAQLKEACNQFVKQYVSDIEKYRVTVKTKMRINHEHGSYPQNFDTFVSAEGYEGSTVNYEVNYNYYIDDVMTGDFIPITVRSNGDLDVLSLNMIGEFDKYSSIDIDQAKCDSLIETQTNAMCKVENYTFLASSNTKIMIICDDVLCMFVVVTPTYEEQKTNEALSVYPIQMLIPIAK